MLPAFAALLAELGLCREALIRKEPLLFIGVSQIPCRGEVLFEMFVCAECPVWLS
jgi:hypothetical protein